MKSKRDLPINRIVLGDAGKKLKILPDKSIDLICTDPPYGYSFMGKNWDTFNEIVEPQGAYQHKKGFSKLPRNKAGRGFGEFFIPIWKECLRILEPGAFAFVMCAPRQDVLNKQITCLTEVGFNVGFTSIYWTYASGFPKAINMGKAVDKRLRLKRQGQIKQGAGTKGNTFPFEHTYEDGKPISDQAKALDGSYGGFQPKPAVEVIIVAMKPLSEKTYVDQALKNGKGITWLDDCRMPIQKGDEPHGGYGNEVIGYGPFDNKGGVEWKESPTAHLGRFPANLLVSNDVLNDGRMSGVQRYKFSGERISKENYDEIYEGGWGKKQNAPDQYGDSGSFSRYFDLDKWAFKKGIKDTFPFLICPKASKSEKNKGLENSEGKYMDQSRKIGSLGGTNPRNRGAEIPRKNYHPTVKPIKLMSYLITLGSRANDLVLDPFVGSGTTCIAAKMLNRNYIGIEKEKEYYEIARKRIKAVPKIKQKTK